MIRSVLIAIISIMFLMFQSPAYSIDISSNTIENYNLKISNKFSKTYCNTIQFGISKDGALKFAIGETNKEFANNELNKFIDYEVLNKNILISLEKNCQIYNFPLAELKKLAFE